jgi:predicted AlkP superfamily pyrophosphatase or phosphodiesterase
MEPLVPRYGTGTLADVAPSLLAGLEVTGMPNALGLPAASKVCLLLVDGLGWDLLRSHAEDAPFLFSLAAERDPITTGFPATTATSIASLGTGLPPGEHGLVGYSFAAREGELLNTLGWHRHAEGRPVDLRSKVVPEQLQPRRTAFERATDAGVAVHLIAPRDQKDSGLTRAVLRGGTFHGVHALGDLAASIVDSLVGDRTFTYAYHADLDVLGHVYGPGSDPWRNQLAFIDRLAEILSGGLPRGAMLAVTADHGMVTVGENDRIDFDTEPVLQEGVSMLGGEARARHVYAMPGAREDVFAAWQSTLGDRAWILRGEDAIAAGWFGPQVAAYVRPRIGDLVVAARGTAAITRSTVESRLSRFIGQHGSLTAEEQLVPLLVTQART